MQKYNVINLVKNAFINTFHLHLLFNKIKFAIMFSITYLYSNIILIIQYMFTDMEIRGKIIRI